MHKTLTAELCWKKIRIQEPNAIMEMQALIFMCVVFLSIFWNVEPVNDADSSITMSSEFNLHLIFVCRYTEQFNSSKLRFSTPTGSCQ